MKKFKSVLVFLLSLIIVFSAFPSTVFAENYKYSSVERISAGAGFDNYAKTDVTLPYTLSVDRAQKDFNTIYINTGKPFKLSSGDNFTITIRIGATATRYKDFEIINFNFQGFAGEESLNNGFLQTGYQKYYDYNTSSIIFSGVSERDLTECYFNVWIQNPIVSPENLNKNFSFTVHSVTVDVESEQSGFFNKVSNFFSDLFNRLTSWFDNLFQWLKDIRDGNVSFAESVKTLFSNITNSIKGFFSELGTKLTDGFKNLTNSISAFFTNLGNNLKDWFDDVGEWFKDIGDRIGNFFSSLWDNISDSISSITNAVSDWWQSVKDFFHSLFVPEDGFFDNYKQNWEKWAKEHFALFFDVEEIFDMLFGFFQGDDMEPGIVIPEIKLPFFNNPVIIPRTTFYFSQLLNQHPMIKRIYDLFQIAFSAIVYGLLLVYLQKTFSKIITNDEEAL